MARVIGHYPEPIQGVSTLSPSNRVPGQASLQENMRSDPVTKLTRRPSLFWKQRIKANVASKSFKVHTYRQAGHDYRVIVYTDGSVQGFKDDVEQTVDGDLTAYVTTASNLVMQNINDTTFVVARDKVIEMSADTDVAKVERVTYLNVTAALNYSETIKVDVTLPGQTTTHITVSVTIPGISGSTPDYAAADRARATSQVAQNLATALNANSQITAIAKGSSVAVWQTGITADYVHLQVQTGQGDRSVVVANQQMQVTTGLPLYAVNGSYITVKPDPQSNRGVYYLHAVSTDPDAVIAPTPVDRKLEEVTWVETRKDDEPYAFDPTTMPHVVRWDAENTKFVAGVPQLPWTERKAGDNNTVRKPSFVGTTIDNVGYMQKRLLLLAGNRAVMSITDDIYAFWRRSATNLLSTDPIDLSSSASGVDAMVNLVPHNRDMMLLASNAQFKIDGTVPLTPQTTSIPLTTTFECQTDVPPVAMGNSVFFPTSYGESTGIHEYVAQANTEADEGFSVTNHVIGYMPGQIEQLTASPNLNILAMTTTGGKDNELFVYEQFVQSKKKYQTAWSKWIIPEENVIEYINLVQNRLEILCIEGGDLILKTMEMYESINTSNEIFLDEYISLTTTDGLTVALPPEYTTEIDTIVVGETDCEFQLHKLPYTQNGNVLTFEEDVRGWIDKDAGIRKPSATVAVGRNFVSKYIPTRPFVYTDEGIADTADDIRVNNLTVAVADTYTLSMRILSPYRDPIVIRNNARILGAPDNLVGVIPTFTGDWRYSFKNRAAEAEAEFFTDEHYSLTVSSISWAGQVHRASKRI